MPRLRLIYARHNRIRNALAQECALARIRYLLEVKLPGFSLRPDDTLLFMPEEAAPRAMDVSAVHPLHPSCLLAEVVPGAAAERAEAAKQASSCAECRAVGWSFSGACAEVTGAWGPAARSLVRL